MPKLETLELEIVQRSRTSTAGVKNLAEALSGLAKAGEAAGNLSKVSDALTGIASAAGGLKEASAGVRTVANAMKRINDVLENAPFAVHGLQRISEALQKIGEAASKLSGVGENIRDINRAAKDAGKIPGTPGGGNGLPTAGDDIVDGESSGALDETAKKAEETRQSVGEATSAVHAFRDSLRGLGKGALNIGKSLGKRMLGNFTKDIKSAVSTMGNLFSSFKRIAMYRALRTAIKGITQGFAEGVKHLYAWADLVGNNFKQSMDSLSTSMNYMKNSLGAMVSPIIDALAPAVDILVDKFVDLINVVNQFLATITGASSWRRAVKEQKEYADETDKAAGAQKRLNHQLMAFDELNNITVNQPSSRGSGNKDDEVTDGSFVVEQLPDWAKDIREAIENGMWKTAGTLLAQKLNGLIDSWDANAFGKKLGEKFQNGIDAYLGFMKTFDWGKLGIKAADFVNGVLKNINPKSLGEAITAKVTAALSFLAEFTWKVDLSSLGTALGEAFNSLTSAENMKNLGMTVAGVITNAVNSAWNFVTTADWAAAGQNVMDSLFTAIKNIDWAKAAETVGKLATGLLDAIVSALDYAITHIDVVLQAVWDFVGTLLGELWNYLLDGIGGLLADFWQYVKDNFFTSGVDDGNGRKDGFVSTAPSGGASSGSKDGSNEPASWMASYTSGIAKMKKALDGVESSATSAKKKISQLPPTEDNVTKFKSQTKNEVTAVNGVKTAATEAGKKVAQIPPTEGQVNGFKKHLTTWNTKLTGIAESSRKAKKAIGEVPTSKKFTFTDAGNGLKNAASRAKTTVTQLNGLQSKYTFTVKSDTLGDKADEAERLYKNLNNINSKSWRVQVTGDMKLKMVSERGNAMYFVEPYATGGFPTGDIFVANEAGPELVGTINGKTAVSSNQEITGIADAVYNTGEEEATLLREQNQLLRQLLAKNTSISLAPNVAAGRWVAQASNAYRKATGG